MKKNLTTEEPEGAEESLGGQEFRDQGFRLLRVPVPVSEILRSSLRDFVTS